MQKFLVGKSPEEAGHYVWKPAAQGVAQIIQKECWCVGGKEGGLKINL